FWSSLPILSGWFSNEPRAAEIATYNSFAIPLSTIMAFLLTLAPLVRFNGFQLKGGVRKSLIVFAVAALIGFGLFYLILATSLVFAVMFSLIVTGMAVYLFNPEFRRPLTPALALFVVTLVVALLAGVKDHMMLLFYATAAMSIVPNVIHLAGYLPSRFRLAGAPLTHFGFGLMLIGVMASSAYDTTERLVIEQGKPVASQTYNFTIAYNGMMHGIEHPNNQLLMSIDDGSGPQEIRPELYYSKRMDGIMRKPYIRRSLGHDLYLSPLQVDEGGASSGLVLKKGETMQQGGYTFTLRGFEIGGHDQMGASSMSVAAVIDVADSSQTTTIRPKIVQGGREDSTSEILPESVALDLGGQKYQVSISQIMADEGAVALDIPGLASDSKPPKLILDITKKPLIILVWIGTTLILLGSLITVFRRRSDLIAIDT
ncbi:MAG: hypothetical protein NTW07_03725, partial [candidate division Zixibacteria bacterium]|nr:hypothetical protein [candidate division Zixibacteria bacterium]